jgi:Ulp1 family protease
MRASRGGRLEVSALVNGIRPADDVVLRLTNEVKLTQADMNRLVGPRPIGHQRDTDLWLNDNVMGGLRHVLREMNAELRSRDETFFADTYFYTFMMEQRNACAENRDKFTYKNVERRCKKSPRNNLLLHRACYFPILLNENHWINATIINGDKKIDVFNPSGKKKENKAVLDNLFKLVQAEYDRLDDKSCIDMDGWSLTDISPDEDFQQGNCYDCGVFTILFMYFHSQDLPISFTQDDVYSCCNGRGVRTRLAHLLWKMAANGTVIDLSQESR